MRLMSPAKDGLSPKATAQFNMTFWSTIPHKESQLVTLFQKELVFLAGPEKIDYAFWFISAETTFVCAFYSNFAQKSVGF